MSSYAGEIMKNKKTFTVSDLMAKQFKTQEEYEKYLKKLNN